MQLADRRVYGPCGSGIRAPIHRGSLESLGLKVSPLGFLLKGSIGATIRDAVRVLHGIYPSIRIRLSHALLHAEEEL